MNNTFISVLRQPDYSFGATEASDFRFEEALSACHDVPFDYIVGGKSAKIVIYPAAAPVKYLKLRFQGDFRCAETVYSDQWERCGSNSYLEWRSVMPHRPLPWFCYVKAGEYTVCYGVKTGADCFAYWQIDAYGVTLFLNLCSGTGGTDLKEPLTACEVVEMVSEPGEDRYRAAQRFSARMCNAPVLPTEPVFGVNNWYWAYGRISRESVRAETDYLMQMCAGTTHRPYMILDDGWQLNRTYGTGAYIGGPWLPNERFGSMEDTVEMINSKGAKAGIWFRPLLTLGDVPEEAKLAPFQAGGVLLDPTHPYTLERVERDAATLRGWGFDLLKHDFSTGDILGFTSLAPEERSFQLCRGDRDFFDKTVTTATAIKRFYAAIQRGAGQADVIACNAFSHLIAGIHSMCRVGGDTSGRSFEWTRRFGVNSVMRLPLNDRLYRVDPDCAPFTEKVDLDLNLDFLEMCAITGMTTLASVTPGILNDAQMERINGIYRIADRDTDRYGIRYYDRNANPEVFVSQDGTQERNFCWEKAYMGSRSVLDWMH